MNMIKKSSDFIKRALESSDYVLYEIKHAELFRSFFQHYFYFEYGLMNDSRYHEKAPQHNFVKYLVRAF